MAESIKVAWLKDKSSEKIAPITTANQVMMDYTGSENLKTKIESIDTKIDVIDTEVDSLLEEAKSYSDIGDISTLESSQLYTDSAVSQKSQVQLIILEEGD